METTGPATVATATTKKALRLMPCPTTDVSNCRTISRVSSLACGPSSRSATRAASPFLVRRAPTAERLAAAALRPGHAEHVTHQPEQPCIAVDVDAVCIAIDVLPKAMLVTRTCEFGRSMSAHQWWFHWTIVSVLPSHCSACFGGIRCICELRCRTTRRDRPIDGCPSRPREHTQQRLHARGSDGAALKLGIPGSILESKIRALEFNGHLFKSGQGFLNVPPFYD